MAGHISDTNLVHEYAAFLDIPNDFLAAARFAAGPWVDVTASPYGAVGDGIADDTAAIQAAINAASLGSMVVYFPKPSVSYHCAGALDCHGKDGLQLLALGGRRGGPILTYSGTAARFLDFRSSRGCKISGLLIQATNASFAGILIDYDHYFAGANDAVFNTIENCSLFATGTATGSVLVSWNHAIVCTLRDVDLLGGDYGVVGVDSTLLPVDGIYSNAHLVEGCHFRDTVVGHIANPGDGWSIIGGAFEPRADGSAGGVIRTASAGTTRSVLIEGVWMADTNNAGTWVDVLTDGLTVSTCTIANCVTCVNVQAGSSSINILGGWYAGYTNGVLFENNCLGTQNVIGTTFDDPTNAVVKGNNAVNIIGGDGSGTNGELSTQVVEFVGSTAPSSGLAMYLTGNFNADSRAGGTYFGDSSGWHVDWMQRSGAAAGRIFMQLYDVGLGGPGGQSALALGWNKGGVWTVDLVNVGAVDTGDVGSRVLQVPN